MSERLEVVSEKKIEYEGVFEATEVTKLIKEWAKTKEYWYYEGSRTESTKKDGKHAEIKISLQNKFTDYAKLRIETVVSFSKLKDIVVKRDSKKKKVQEGKVSISMTGILETDYENRWETKPVFYFLRVLFEKYVYSPYTSQFEKKLKEDFLSLQSELKAFLNLEKFVQTDL